MVTVSSDVIRVSVNPMRDVLWLQPKFEDDKIFPHNWNSDVDPEKNRELKTAIRQTTGISFSELSIGEGAIKLLGNVGYFTDQQIKDTVTTLLPILEQELERELSPEYQ